MGRDISREQRIDPSKGTQPKKDKMSKEEVDWHVKMMVAERGNNLAGEEFIHEDQPNFPPAVQDFDKIEQIEPFVLLVPLRVKCPGSKNEDEFVEVWQLKFIQSKFIEQVLMRIKNSINIADKVTVRAVAKLLEQKQMEEKKYDTARVKSYPKRINVEGKSKQLEFISKDVKQINNVSMLKTMFEQLQKTSNPLEREAFDQVGDQLDGAQG